MNRKLSQLLLLGLAVLFTLLVLLPAIPAHKSLLTRDAGVFQYIGWRVNQGEVPYRDVWDHKPPLIFWINALSLRISQKAGWGIWILEFISLLAAVLLCLGLLRRLSGTASAILATGLCCLNLSLVLNGGNFTTEFALPLQFAFLWLIWEAESKGEYGWRAVSLGALAALLFFTKQTTVAIPAAWVVFVLGRAGLWSLQVHFAHGRFVHGLSQYPARAEIASHRSLAMTIGRFAAGAGAVSAAIAGYFLSQGALDELWDAAFVFNLYYAQSSLLDRLHNLSQVFNYMDAGGLVWLALLGWAAALVRLVRKKESGPKEAVWAVAALALPLEFLHLGASGKVYYHYFITLIPVMAVFTAAVFDVVGGAVGDESNNKENKRLKPLAVEGTKPTFAGFGFARNLIVIFFGAAAVLGAYPAYIANWQAFARDSEDSVIQEEISAEIEKLLPPENSLLAWGAETRFNFLSQRRSPTRYVYQYPLYRGYAGEYASQENILAFFNELAEDPPGVILVPAYTDFKSKEFDLRTPEIKEAFQALVGNYTLYKEIGSFRIFTRNFEPGE